MAEAQARVPGVEARAGKFPGPSLIPALNAIQERVGWLPREELVALSREVHRPLYEIEGLVSFYPHFRADPPVKAELRVCHDLSCWLRGAATCATRTGHPLAIDSRRNAARRRRVRLTAPCIGSTSASSPVLRSRRSETGSPHRSQRMLTSRTRPSGTAYRVEQRWHFQTSARSPSSAAARDSS
mgnify:CR=1 FL=1